MPQMTSDGLNEQQLTQARRLMDHTPVGKMPPELSAMLEERKIKYGLSGDVIWETIVEYVKQAFPAPAEQPNWIAESLAAYEQQQNEAKQRADAKAEAERLARVERYGRMVEELKATWRAQFGGELDLGVPEEPKTIQDPEFSRVLHVRAVLPGGYWLFYGDGSLVRKPNMGPDHLYALALPTPEAFALDEDVFPDMLYETSDKLNKLVMGQMLTRLKERRAELQAKMNRITRGNAIEDKIREFAPRWMEEHAAQARRDGFVSVGRDGIAALENEEEITLTPFQRDLFIRCCENRLD